MMPRVGLDVLLAAFDEPVLIIREGRVIAANPAALALLGDHITGADARIAIRHPAAAEALLGDAPENARGVELDGLGGPGQQWAMTVAALLDGHRLIRLTDQSQARAAEKMRADFVANASHELRTPLATIIGFVETLQDEEAAGDVETRARFLGIMRAEATRMRDLINDLMSLSRIEAERFVLPRERVELDPLARGVAKALDRLAESTGSEIAIENQVRHATVQGDQGQLAQLLSNLVTNALTYGRAGAPVRIRIEEDGYGLLRLCVIDQGEGIAAEHIPRLTERFYRVDAGRSRSAGGTGLGLAIAKHIALRHRGRLDIVSAPGEGTSVCVSLPRGPEEAPL